jgi:peptidyl-prolyl cis-trans isomerase B (cyclophilin B)
MAVPKDKSPSQFIGTPLVISVRDDKRRDAPPGPIVFRIEPLRYATLSTDKGDLTIVFFYDVAPHTAGNFMRLAEGGYYDGLTFHRIVPDFVIQGGDPKGDGTGGPGYHIEAEFSSKEHREGVLSMARQADPIEAQGAMPRAEARDSAGSQFFICLDYEHTKQLDGRYTAFGQVVDGMDAVKAIAKVPTDPQTQRPKQPQIIKSVKIIPVTADHNPYAKMLNLSSMPTTMP